MKTQMNQFGKKESAIEYAKKQRGYVIVIESSGKYYVENEPSMIRSWETVIYERES